MRKTRNPRRPLPLHQPRLEHRRPPRPARRGGSRNWWTTRNGSLRASPTPPNWKCPPTLRRPRRLTTSRYRPPRRNSRPRLHCRWHGHPRVNAWRRRPPIPVRLIRRRRCLPRFPHLPRTEFQPPRPPRGFLGSRFDNPPRPPRRRVGRRPPFPVPERLRRPRTPKQKAKLYRYRRKPRCRLVPRPRPHQRLHRCPRRVPWVRPPAQPIPGSFPPRLRRPRMRIRHLRLIRQLRRHLFPWRPLPHRHRRCCRSHRLRRFPRLRWHPRLR